MNKEELKIGDIVLQKYGPYIQELQITGINGFGFYEYEIINVYDLRDQSLKEIN